MLRIRDLTVDFTVPGGTARAVSSVDLDLARGEVLALVGESGSGKSTTAMAIPGLLGDSATVAGSITLDGQELVGASEKTLTAIRGEKVAVVFQEPMTALNPVYTIGWQIAEAIRMHRRVSKDEAKAQAITLLKLVDMPEPEKRIGYYPHQLSGGQRQRAMIAQALACDPELLIADEPTTALDVTVQAEILDLMRDLRSRVDAAILLITHDMGVVADMADRIMVMKDGRVVESGTADKIFHHADDPYTRSLLEAVPHLGSSVTGTVEAATAEPRQVTPAFSLDGAVVEFSGRRSLFRAVDDISLAVHPGEVVGLVGESGSGKSTVGKVAVGLVTLAEGTATLGGVDITRIKNRHLRPLRSKVGFIFQDPGSSLDPRWPVGQSIAEPLELHTRLGRAEREKRVSELLDRVRIPASMRNRYPHQLSGGQRQRIGVARALALDPALLIADEPTSALDVSVQVAVLDLLRELQADQGFACLFISHDLAVVEQMADRVVVMRSGKIVESGTTAQVLTDPRELYTKELLAAVPVPDPEQQAQRRRARAELAAAAAATTVAEGA
ncbi:ABC transporter ATP-binding protein [Millisia brevis]|uniref:ABC transporter ATP-binding protein n=1 Tax=Millisia brevis TaxID=264148 RepID=UPI00083249A8|nr:ABC transporter ATP-binding protein [Millisia brevis]